MPGPFVGFENDLWALVEEPAFWNAVWVTGLYTVLTVGFTTLLALGVALLLAPGGRLRFTVRTLLILPFAMSPALVGVSFRFMFNPEFGLFDAFFGIVLPFFLLFRDFGILYTRLGLILANLSIVTPFALWMIKGFIDGIPRDTEEAALVDGSSRLQVIRNIVLPMAAPGIVTAAIFCFIIAWNDFLFALILTTNKAVTLTVGLALFQAEEGDLWNLLAAAGIIMVPMFVLALIIQKHFVQGMTMGAVR